MDLLDQDGRTFDWFAHGPGHQIRRAFLQAMDLVERQCGANNGYADERHRIPHAWD
jgi:hypothetical protein